MCVCGRLNELYGWQCTEHEKAAQFKLLHLNGTTNATRLFCYEKNKTNIDKRKLAAIHTWMHGFFLVQLEP